MSESIRNDGAGCLVTIVVMLMALAFMFSLKIGRLRSEVLDLQRRVAELEQKK